jgi:hypothetical protein
MRCYCIRKNKLLTETDFVKCLECYNIASIGCQTYEFLNININTVELLKRDLMKKLVKHKLRIKKLERIIK